MKDSILQCLPIIAHFDRHWSPENGEKSAKLNYMYMLIYSFIFWSH